MRTQNKRYKKSKKNNESTTAEPKRVVLEVQNGTLGSKSDLGGK